MRITSEDHLVKRRSQTRDFTAVSQDLLEGLFEQCLLLNLVDLGHTSCGGGLRTAGNASQLRHIRQSLWEVQCQE